MTAIRTATTADLVGIMRVERATFPEDAWSEQTMRAELESAHGRYLIVESARGVDGYAGLRVIPGSKDADIQTIAVDEPARGRGLGRTMLRELMDEARRRGAHRLFLEVRADNPAAQALYTSEGFTRLRRRRGYYQPSGVDAIVMLADLTAPSGPEPTGQNR